MANPETGCRCGSGAHPRRCALHPFAFDVHIAYLNLYGSICHNHHEGEDPRELHEEAEEAIKAYREALLAKFNYERDQLKNAL